MNTTLSMSTFLQNASASFTAAQSLFSLSQQACALSKEPGLDPQATRFFFTGTEPGRFSHVIAENVTLAKNAAARLGKPESPIAQIDTRLRIAGATKDVVHARVGHQELAEFLDTTPGGDSLVVLSQALTPEIWTYIEQLSFDFSSVFANGFSIMLNPDLRVMLQSVKTYKGKMRTPTYLPAERLVAMDEGSLIIPKMSVDSAAWEQRTLYLISYIHEQFLHPEITQEAPENVMQAIRTLGSALAYGDLSHVISMLQSYYLELLGPTVRSIALAE